jgi:hypothetical protein
MTSLDVATLVLVDGALGFFTSVRTESAKLRFITWLGISFGVGYFATIVYFSRNEMAIFALVYLVVLGLVAAGVGSLLGYVARRFRRPSFLFRPRAPEERSEPYQGPQCVACREPIEFGATLCPKCGYTQPQ